MVLVAFLIQNETKAIRSVNEYLIRPTRAKPQKLLDLDRKTRRESGPDQRSTSDHIR